MSQSLRTREGKEERRRDHGETSGSHGSFSPVKADGDDWGFTLGCLTAAPRTWIPRESVTLSNQFAAFTDDDDETTTDLESYPLLGQSATADGSDPATGTQVVPEQPPAYGPQSNGAIECGVRQFKGMLRTLSLALESRIGARIPVTHPAMWWFVEHTTELMAKHLVGKDGRTPYERLFHRKSAEWPTLSSGSRSTT